MTTTIDRGPDEQLGVGEVEARGHQGPIAAATGRGGEGRLPAGPIEARGGRRMELAPQVLGRLKEGSAPVTKKSTASDAATARSSTWNSPSVTVVSSPSIQPAEVRMCRSPPRSVSRPRRRQTLSKPPGRTGELRVSREARTAAEPLGNGTRQATDRKAVDSPLPERTRTRRCRRVPLTGGHQPPAGLGIEIADAPAPASRTSGHEDSPANPL